MVDVGDHRLYADCAGHGAPTVVFLHGLGGAGQDWAKSASLLKDVRTCWYDRLNVGMSDHDDARHSALDSVDDLHNLLAKAAVEPPYILVGHSYGGMLAVMYAEEHPDEVAGMVLADPTLPFEPELDPPGTAEDVRADMNGNQENLDAYEGYASAGSAESSLPDVPVIVMNGELADLPTGWARADYDRKLRAWVQGLHAGTVVDCDCDHDMPRDVPEVVAENVRELITSTA